MENPSVALIVEGVVLASYSFKGLSDANAFINDVMVVASSKGLTINNVSIQIETSAIADCRAVARDIGAAFTPRS